MDFNNNNLFNHNMNPYFTPTSFDSDNSNPAMYNMDQLYMSDWVYPTQYDPYPQSYDQNFQNYFHSSKSTWGFISPEIIKHLICKIYSPTLIHILLFLFHQLKKSDLKKNIEAMLESQQ